MFTHKILAATALFAAIATPALADCPVTATEAQEILRAFPAAEAAERSNRLTDALDLYVKAQGFLCDGNPNAAQAARRAAALSLPFAKAAEQRGTFDEAFRRYEQGGHYGLADRALLSHLRRHPDDVSLVGRHISHFAQRSLASFAENHRDQLAAAGAYLSDATLRSELEAMPTRGIERAMTREAAAFDERYLAERVRLVQARPEPDADNMAAMQSAIAAEEAFRKKWPGDLVKQAQEQLLLARQWAAIVPDGEALRTRTDEATRARAESRASILIEKYAGAPEMLEAAADYYRSLEHLTPAESRVTRVRSRAATLGDRARAEGRFTLAIDYYDVAGLSEKAELVRAQRQEAVMQRARPAIDEARRAAEAIAAQFGDPAVVDAMKKEAEAARAAAEAAKAAPASRTKGTADLERELGLR
ncbi:MAG: hypothetical protein AB7H96_18195 [Vicinamibacterales bacterium]